MLRRMSTFGAFLVCAVFLLILLVSHKLVTSSVLEETAIQSVGRTIQSWGFNDIERTEDSLLDGNVTDINAVIAGQRKAIQNEMADYNYQSGVKASGLSDLVPELGGVPLRNLIITTWRSGSTFLGDILNSQPGNYYHYEPLLDFGIVQVRGPPRAKEALQVLKSLLHCNYTGLDRYLDYGKSHTWLFNHNLRLWEQCEAHPQICWLPEFLNPFCRLFPFQSMKVVRLRLHLVEDLLNDKRLNVRVVLLVRDPRGTLQSRKHRDWCPGFPDCDRPELLCADLLADYTAATRLAQRFPSRFTAIRYEDLSLDPYGTTRKLFEFYGLHLHHSVTSFLDTHTKVDVGGVSSTFRNSKLAPFHWRYNLTHREVRNIQKQCGQAMKHWGYVKAENKTHQHEFNPLQDFTLT